MGDQAAESAVCPMCGSERCRQLATVSGHAFRECRTCGLCFSPDVHPSCSDRYHVRYEGLPGHEPRPEQGWADLEFLAPVWQHLPAGPLRILDFGAGESLVPELLRRRCHRVVALDMAPPLVPHPDRVTGRLGEASLPLQRFDLVYAFQVFEHLPRPRPVLDALVRLLAPGGLLAIHTDMEVAEREPFAQWWYVQPPDHCTFYRRRTFAYYAASAGLALVHGEEKLVCLRRC